MTLQAQQIVAEALAIAKAPGFTAQGGRALNTVLADLCLHWNLKANLFVETIAVAAGTNGPFALGATYNRTYDLSFTTSGQPYFLRPGTLAQYDAEVQKATVSNYPYEWATDWSASPVNMYVYPQSNGAISLQHRYFKQQADITTPETSSTVPWFTDREYLIHATATLVMKITDDERWAAYQEERLNLLRRHLLIAADDEQQIVKEVQLDPRRFANSGALRPTKLFPF